MDVELKPCPFCGGQPKVGETNTGVPGMEDCGYAFVECCIVHAHSEESVEDAIEKWNNRHGDADRSAELTTAWMAGVESVLERTARDAEDAVRLDWLCSGRQKKVERTLSDGWFRVYQDMASIMDPEDWHAMTDQFYPTARAAIDAARAGERG